MSILEVNDEGSLCVPPELIGGAKPHAKFELELVGDALVLRPVHEERPFWQRATPCQRAEAFRRWSQMERPIAPDVGAQWLRREKLYD